MSIHDLQNALLSKARALPKAPGVYLMKDNHGRVIYVGKAVVLRDRVSSYFIPSTDLGPKKQPMLALIADFEVLECESEWEALLTENRLIKDLHPKFNVRLTDDKTFPYLAITTRDEFPAVFVTRQPGHEDYRGGKILGPFTNVYALRDSVQLLQRMFRFRTCAMEIHQPQGDGDSEHDPRRYFRPCLLYPIRRCSAPCAAKISRDDYRADIDRFIRFLESKRSAMLAEMRQEMEQAARDLRFEKAAALRDQIRTIVRLDHRGRKSDGWQPETEAVWADPRVGLEALRDVLGVDQPIRRIEAIDIAHLQGGETVGAKVCFIDGRPLKQEYRRYRIRTTTNDDCAAIREVVDRRYRDAGAGHELYPDIILIDGGLGQLHAAQEVFTRLASRPPMVVALAKKEELLYIQARNEPLRLPRNHAGLQLCQAIRDEAHRFAQSYHHLLRKKKLVGEKPRKTRTAARREDGS